MQRVFSGICFWVPKKNKMISPIPSPSEREICYIVPRNTDMICRELFYRQFRGLKRADRKILWMRMCLLFVHKINFKKCHLLYIPKDSIAIRNSPFIGIKHILFIGWLALSCLKSTSSKTKKVTLFSNIISQLLISYSLLKHCR